MPGRSKWLDPARMARGIAWRFQALKAKAGPQSDDQLTRQPIGDSFRNAVLQRFGVHEVDELDPTQRMWAEFRLSSVERGRSAVSLMGGPARFRGKRVLDVGCAYAGFLIAAAEAGAREVVGIDVDPELLDLAHLLLADHAVAARLEQADLIDPSLPKHIGQFDIVLCNDVLEHVKELEQAAMNLERLLIPGGRIFLEIPNGQAVQYIDSDGHYKLPGITLLDHKDAERWFRAFFQDSYPYRTYFYAPVEYYLALFSRVGIQVRVLNAPSTDRQAVTELARQWERTRQRLDHLSEEFPDKPADLINQIQSRANEITTRFGRLLTTAVSSAVPEERHVASSILLTTFGLDSFLLEGSKPA